MPSDLTILLPLKGRHLHTLRFLWHANRVRLPYRFLVADGEVHPAIAAILEQPATAFPNLDVEYVRYPDDASFSDFYKKMAKAVARITTPFVMQTDNDDFLMRSGVDRCVQFLKTHRDFASFGAGLGAFSLGEPPRPGLDQVAGPLQRILYRYTRYKIAHDMTSDLVAERIRTAFWCPPIYYNVFRTEALTTILHELAELDFGDLELHEAYFGARALSLGKCRLDQTSVHYLRQMGTGMNEVRADTAWIHHLLREGFSDDFNAMVSRLGSAVARSDGIDPRSFSEEIRRLYGDKLRNDQRNRYRPVARSVRYRIGIRNAVQTNFPALFGALRSSRRKLRSLMQPTALRRDWRAFCNSLRSDGASEDYIATVSEEVRTIKESLCHEEFLAFLGTTAPKLLADWPSVARTAAAAA